YITTAPSFLSLCSFFFSYYAHPPALHSFPTRRSSDLSTAEAEYVAHQQEPGVPIRLLPLDLPFLMGRFVDRLKPHVLILIETELDRKSTRLNSSHVSISYAVFCLKKKKKKKKNNNIDN